MRCVGNEPEDGAGLIAAQLIGFVPYCFGVLLILLIFTMRMDYTFDGSLIEFAYSRKMMNTLYGLVFLDIFVTIITLIITFIDPESIVGFIFAFLLIVLFIFHYILLTRLFSRKIIMLMNYKIKENNSNRENNNNNNGKDKTSTNSHGVIVDVTSIDSLVRYTISVLIGFISTVLCFLIGMGHES